MRPLTTKDSETRSADLVAENISQLRDLFPEAFIEGKVDFNVLRQLLGDAVDEGDEKYGLNWHGKRQAQRLALTPSTGTLRPCPEESVDWESTQNLMIEGDNLEVLKLLQKSYSGKVKLIYIDPPYNTGKDFVYPDNYRENIENYLRITGQVDEVGQRVTTNTDASGRFHTDWLNMMYPRLKLARDLLRDDGVLVVSISDAEIHNLRSSLDEIFGGDNLLGCVIWNSTKSVTNTALLSVSHTYNLVYARNRGYFVTNRLHFRLLEEGEGFSNPDGDSRGPWKADPFQVGGERPNQMYPITNPKTHEVYLPNPGNSWKNELKVFEKLMADDRIVFGVSGEAGPQRKRFLSEAEERGRVAKTWWDDIDTTANATVAAQDLMGESVFDNPKPVSLIQRFVQLGTHDSNETIVMDFFAGSGTTAQAVLQQNLDDGGTRRHILVQLPEPLNPKDKEQRFAASYCDKIGKPRSISELTKEHLRRYGVKLQSQALNTNNDTGFRVFKLDSSNIRAWKPDPDNLEQTLIDHVEHIRKGRTELDILYELLLKLGLDLCAPIETREIAGKSVHAVGDGRLIACLVEQISDEDVDLLASGIVKWHGQMESTDDTMVAFRDSAFANDIVKANCTEALRQYGIKDVRSI